MAFWFGLVWVGLGLAGVFVVFVAGAGGLERGKLVLVLVLVVVVGWWR